MALHVWIALFILTFSASLSAVDCSTLVDIKKVNSKIIVDHRYATTNNLFAEAFYPPGGSIYVERDVALRLGRVQRELEKRGMGLILHEGYRPASVQAALDACRRDQGPDVYRFDDSAHYRKGIGVDVSLYYLDGLVVDLPSAWGEDGAKAYQDYPNHPAHIYHNKIVLTEVMEHNGFVPYRERWWHYDLRGWESTSDLSAEYIDLLPPENLD